MVYLEEKGEFIYSSGKKGGNMKVFTTLDWLATPTAHILMQAFPLKITAPYDSFPLAGITMSGLGKPS